MHTISLGYNCRTTSTCVDRGWRQTKSNGYKTCPFDLCISTYEGVVACIRDKFEGFTDPAHLKLQTVPADILQSKGDEELVYNTKYGFVFLHESPGHADLYKTEQWPNGKYHFVANNWALFRERYAHRIQAFHEYIHSGQQVRFVIGCPNNDISELHDAIRSTYPTLEYIIVPMDIDQTHYRICKNYAEYRSK